MKFNPYTKKMEPQLGYYAYIDGVWTALSQFVDSVRVHEAYKANHGVYWFTSATVNPWRQMIVPGRWRPIEGEPKPLQMLRLVGAI